MDDSSLAAIYRHYMVPKNEPMGQDMQGKIAQQIMLHLLMNNFMPGSTIPGSPAEANTNQRLQSGGNRQNMPNIPRAYAASNLTDSPQMRLDPLSQKDIDESPTMGSMTYNSVNSPIHQQKLSQINLMNLFRLLAGTAGRPNVGIESSPARNRQLFQYPDEGELK